MAKRGHREGKREARGESARNAVGEARAYCIADGFPRRSLGVALVVATLLNAINQGDVLLSGATPDIAKLVLTDLVPYAVATYGCGVVPSAQRIRRRDRAAGGRGSDRSHQPSACRTSPAKASPSRAAALSASRWTGMRPMMLASA